MLCQRQHGYNRSVMFYIVKIKGREDVEDERGDNEIDKHMRIAFWQSGNSYFFLLVLFRMVRCGSCSL